jgi:hypothetical protein
MTGLEIGVATVIQSDFDFYSRYRKLDSFSNRVRDLLTTKNAPNPAIAHTGAWHWPVSGE